MRMPSFGNMSAPHCTTLAAHSPARPLAFALPPSLATPPHPLQVVLLAQVLSAEVNHGYRHFATPLESFNSTPVLNLAHLAALVDACSQPFYVFGLEGGRFAALEAAAAAEAGVTILETHGIAADRSPELQALRDKSQAAGAEGAAAPAAAGMQAADGAAG